MIAATQGSERHAWVTGPLGEKVNASWGISGDGKTAFIEMAAASGLELVPAEKRDPLVTTSRGTGELILQALESGATNIIIALAAALQMMAAQAWYRRWGRNYATPTAMKLVLAAVVLIL